MSGQGSFPQGAGYRGAEWFLTAGSPFNAIAFLCDQLAAGRAHVAMVKVEAVYGGGTGTPPTVDVQPLVSQIDGFGNQTPHGVVHGMPCFRLQGGAGAVILDPVVGDIGIAVICDRDISNVKATAAAAPPGSWRQNDWADGCYFGGFLNAGPTHYVQISSAGIVVNTTATLTINSANVTLDSSGNLAAKGEVTAFAGSANSVGASTHTHKQGNDSANDIEQPTDAPTPGT